MKKSIFLFAFLFIAGMASAQSAEGKTKSCSKTCAKTCSKAKGETMKTSADAEIKVASALSAADIAAEADESIEKRVCEFSGNISYYKKQTCEKSGKVSYDEVFYDDGSRMFVDQVASNESDSDVKGVKAASVEGEVEAKAKSCSKTCKKTCSKAAGK